MTFTREQMNGYHDDSRSAQHSFATIARQVCPRPLSTQAPPRGALPTRAVDCEDRGGRAQATRPRTQRKPEAVVGVSACASAPCRGRCGDERRQRARGRARAEAVHACQRDARVSATPRPLAAPERDTGRSARVRERDDWLALRGRRLYRRVVRREREHEREHH